MVTDNRFSFATEIDEMTAYVWMAETVQAKSRAAMLLEAMLDIDVGQVEAKA